MISHRKRISSFVYLNITQFLGALNDNIFKSVIVFLLISIMGVDKVTLIMVLSGATFIVPFLLFSIPAGVLADKLSKRNITIFTKILELAVMLLGLLAFTARSSWGSLVVLFLMATQSAIFGPSKYGIVPELVPYNRITPANGVLTGLTVIATIAGTFLASALTDLSHHNFPLIAGFCILVAVLGLAASLCIGYTSPGGSKRKMTLRIVTELIRVLKRSRTENYLFAALFGSSYFYLFGAFIQLNIIPFSVDTLGLTAVQGNYIFAISAVGIALGAYSAGHICGGRSELGLSPFAALGLSVLLLILPWVDHSLPLTIATVFILGICGGIFLVPFDAYIQAVSQERHRGQNIAVSNLLSFIGVAIAVVLLYVLGPLLGLSPLQGFIVLAFITLGVGFLLLWRLSDTVVRLVARFLLKKALHPTVVGQTALGGERSALILCTSAIWKEALLLMYAIETRYIRFFVAASLSHKASDRILCRLAKAKLYTGDLRESGECLLTSLERGYAVVIIAPQAEEAATLLQASELATISHHPLVKATFSHEEKGRPITATFDQLISYEM